MNSHEQRARSIRHPQPRNGLAGAARRGAARRGALTHRRPRQVGTAGTYAVTVLVLVLAAGCSSGGASTATSTKTTKPLPAGRYPSTVSKEVCKSDAPHDVGEALGEKATVTTPTWVNHLYSCSYLYPTAKMTLTVKELSSPAETTSYFNSLGTQLGVSRKLDNLGQGAFQTTDGSVVVRKDYKVLLVDDSGLPAQFGNPPTDPGNIALTVADVVLGCWEGD